MKVQGIFKQTLLVSAMSLSLLLPASMITHAQSDPNPTGGQVGAVVVPNSADEESKYKASNSQLVDDPEKKGDTTPTDDLKNRCAAGDKNSCNAQNLVQQAEDQLKAQQDKIIADLQAQYAQESGNSTANKISRDEWTERRIRENYTHVGVIPQDGNCPAGSSMLQIHTDDEDHKNANAHYGWIGATQVGSNTTYTFCRVSGAQFNRVSINNTTNYPYDVLSLDSFCPAGSQGVWRFQDNEDGANQNWNSGPIYPNSQPLHNTLWRFCHFNANNLFLGWGGTMSTFPNLGIKYGVFAPAGFVLSLANGGRYTDDEDFLNLNFWINGPTSAIYGSNNTMMQLARVQ